jgi:hypothetical protein
MAVGRWLIALAESSVVGEDQWLAKISHIRNEGYFATVDLYGRYLH